MTFLNPLLLLGLAAAAIPLIIHLFNFRRPRKINFSSLAFLQELQKSTMQRVRVKQLLLLILRTLAIACLVLAFARPTLTGSLGGSLGARATTSIAIVLDNSRSMQMRDGQGEYLDQAKDMASALVEQMDTGDELYIVPVADLSTPTERPLHTMKHLGLDAVQEVEVAPGAGVVTDAWYQALDLLSASTNINKEVYVVSDFQESALTDTTLDARLGAITTYIVPVGTVEHVNVAVTDVEVASRIIEVGQPVRINATVINYGQETIEGYVASVFIEGERVAQATVDLEPNVPQNTQFIVTPQRRGWLSGVVQVEDDAFASDNIRHFALHVPERRQLLIVRGENQRSDFLELALSSDLTRGRVNFDLETIEESDLATRRLGTYSAIVLVGLRSISSGESALLKEYVQEGGGVLFFPGEGGFAEDYNSLFETLSAGQFSGFSGTWGSRRSVASFEQVDLEHPLFDGVFEQQRGFRQQITVESPALYYVMNYSPGAGTEQSLISLSNGFPFLQEIRDGQGTFFLLTVAPDIRWSDLPQKGLFIPLLYRCMYYLSASESVAGDQLIIGKASDLRVGGVAESNRLKLIAPDEEEIVPEQRNLFGASLLHIDASLQLPGIYNVMSEDQLIRKVAMNLDVRESDLSTYNPDEAREVLGAMGEGSVRILDLSSSDGPDHVLEELQKERTGVELWNVFLLLALIFMVIEMLVARQWRPEAVPA